MMTKFYTMRRKSMKWYKTLFFHLVNLCEYNAFVVYKSLHPNTKLKFLQFRMALIRQLLEQSTTATPVPTAAEQMNRLTGRHFLEYNPSTSTREHGMRSCQVCKGKQSLPSGKKLRRETVYRCKQCQVPLCPVPCFEIYHTK